MNFVKYITYAFKYRTDPFYVEYLQGKKVLDNGCGAGEFLGRDPENFVGIDIASDLVKCAHQKGYNAECMSAFDLKFPDNEFDAVRAAQLIEHFSPSEAILFLQETLRVVKPGGVVFITTPGVKNVWNTFSHIRPYPPASIKKLILNETEKYLQLENLNFSLELAHGSRFYSKIKFLNFLYGILDIAVPCKNPIGWTIILRKNKF